MAAEMNTTLAATKSIITFNTFIAVCLLLYHPRGKQ
jgi:hypothetical protein